MRKRILVSVIIAITLGVLSSCIYNDYALPLDKVPSEQTYETDVKFLSNIFKTRPYSSRLIGEEEWEPGDAIGIYMLEKHNHNIVERINNVRHITIRGGYLGNFVAEYNAVVFPKDGRDVRFMSYFPYNESVINSIYKIDVSKQYPQSDLNFFYSFDTHSTYNKNIESKKIPISFTNQMAKILIHIRNGYDLQGYDLADMKVYLSGLSTNADFDLLTGKMINYTGTSPIFPSRLIAGKGNVYTGETIVIPASDLPDAKIVIDMNNGNAHKESDVYTWSLGKALEKGRRYTYNITVSRSGITVNSTIHNWNISMSNPDA